MSFPAAGTSFPGRRPAQLRHVGTSTEEGGAGGSFSLPNTMKHFLERMCEAENVRGREWAGRVCGGMWVPVHYCIPDHPFWVPAFRLQTNFDPPLDTLHTHTFQTPIQS